jgi:hypothetical protein
MSFIFTVEERQALLDVYAQMGASYKLDNTTADYGDTPLY